MIDSKANTPWLLSRNRVERFFIGGGRLDAWQRLEPQSAYGDSTFSEELLVNTNRYIGPGKPEKDGYSLAHATGEVLRDMIAAEPQAFLGERIWKAHRRECPVLCKGGDTTGRLILQYHPTQAFARQHLQCDFGKTEAWYMLDTRTEAPHYSYVGFKPGITRERFETLVAQDDVQGMLQSIHRIYFQPGDVLLVPAGTIHAMGPETTFVEVHEACDYTFRFERDNYGRRMKDEDMHYGLGFATLFDGLSFEGVSVEEMDRRVHFRPVPLSQGEGWIRETLLPRSACPTFSIERITLNGAYKLTGDGDYALLVGLRGDATLDDQPLPQGRAAFVPAALCHLSLRGNGAELLLIKPGDA